MITFAMIGTGWRAEFYLRIVAACPEKFQVAGVIGRNPAKAADLGKRFNVPIYDSVDALLHAARPQFMLVNVSRGAALPLMAQLSALDLPILCETPPGETLDDLYQLWALVEKGARIQVAEQYWAQPHHAARLAFAHSGKLGTVTQAQTSFAHGYHGISLLRRFLNVTFDPVTIQRRRASPHRLSKAPVAMAFQVQKTSVPQCKPSRVSTLATSLVSMISPTISISR